MSLVLSSIRVYLFVGFIGLLLRKVCVNVSSLIQMAVLYFYLNNKVSFILQVRTGPDGQDKVPPWAFLHKSATSEKILGLKCFALI